nr:hypothetical protein BaRGS_000334 [Batillaria attramentaria]
MTSNITDAPNSSVWATDSPTGNGSLDRLVQEGDDGEHHETTWLLVEFPWIPALIVGCCMVVFLSLSFYSHHKRVRRKRELLMDYLFILLNSGNWNRGRSVSILCNTNSIALTELGRSVKIKRKFEKQHSKEDRLSEKYLKDLVANMTHGRKKELTRFVSDPVHRFTRVGGPKSVRKKSLSMGMFESSLGVHGGPLFPYDMGHSLDRGVLLDPSAQPGITVPREGPLEIVDWKDGRRGHREGHRGPEKGQLETVLSLDSLVRMDSSQGVRYTSNVQRLPRFQVRSGLQRHQQLLARHCSIPGESGKPKQRVVMVTLFQEVEFTKTHG